MFTELKGGNVNGAPFDVHALDGTLVATARSPQERSWGSTMHVDAIFTEVRNPLGRLLLVHVDEGGFFQRGDEVLDGNGYPVARLETRVGFNKLEVHVFTGGHPPLVVRNQRGFVEFGAADDAGAIARFTTAPAGTKRDADHWWVELYRPVPEPLRGALVSVVFTLNLFQNRQRIKMRNDRLFD